MRLARIRLCNFWSFGAESTEIDFDALTFMLGPNGAGKTAVLLALARMFSLDPAQRRVKRSDFHVPADEDPNDPPDCRELWVEADFEFAELSSDDEECAAVPANFSHMQLVAEDGPAQVRIRLTAVVDQDNDIEESLTYIIREDENGVPVEQSAVSKQERNAIQVHYLPARRDPADHISYSTSTLLGRALRAANWSNEREQVTKLTSQISDSLADNPAIDSIKNALTAQWIGVHKGTYYANPAVSFARSEIENLLRLLTIDFSPGHGEGLVDFSRLSDGQQSLLYLSLVLAMQDIGQKVLAGELDAAFDIDKLRPALFVLIAIEEPENSLSPHYLGRVIRVLKEFAERNDAQALVATHSPALLRRIPPEALRYLRLDEKRQTTVRPIELPEDEAPYKFVREGVQAFPELYFSRLVVLGEGDSEEIVLPRLLEARQILADDASISVVPLGGRHVNHFWRLLNGLGIPHVTLLDLDLARYQGGWGRIRYAGSQLIKYADSVEHDLTEEEVGGIPTWDDEQGILIDDDGWIAKLESLGVFYSTPLDLDFMMMRAYPSAYRVKEEALCPPDEEAITAVLGKKHDVESQYSSEEQSFFDAYHQRFKLDSKPTSHLRAMASMSDEQLLSNLPDVLERMFDQIESKLDGLIE